ncbi:MAG TPA: hypothetical protein VEH50_09795 [Methylomirabilota bacterium]|nr:hypothetical protein [Methylomirabilota bacterium]
MQLAAGPSSFGFHGRRTALLLALPREYAFDGDGFDLFPNPFLFKEAIEG